MLVWNTIHSFTQSFIESFPVLFWELSDDRFGVVPASFLCFEQIIQLNSS